MLDAGEKFDGFESGERVTGHRSKNPSVRGLPDVQQLRKSSKTAALPPLENDALLHKARARS
jgi:hypothetical protein